MAAIVGIWWVWLSLALLLGIVEIMMPGFIFLGFALGAVVMAVLVAILPNTLGAPVAIAIFAGLSLIAWIALRIGFRKQGSDARIITHDIND